MPNCPFANLHEPACRKMGPGSHRRQDEECVWVRPELVARIRFLEWTGADHLRHTKFIALRDDKDPAQVGRET